MEGGDEEIRSISIAKIDGNHIDHLMNSTAYYMVRHYTGPAPKAPQRPAYADRQADPDVGSMDMVALRLMVQGLAGRVIKANRSQLCCSY